MELNPEELLFRYRPYNANTVSALRDNKLYFSTPENFNDPYDSLFYVNKRKLFTNIGFAQRSHMKDYVKENIMSDMPESAQMFSAEMALRKVNDDVFRKAFFSEVDNQIEVLRKELRKNLKVICLSEKYLDNLMWSHYADNHKGFLIGYGKEDLKNAEVFNRNGQKEKVRVELVKVDYTDRRPDLGPYLYFKTPEKFGYHDAENDKSIKKEERILKRVISTKAVDWKYESEWRIIPNKDYISENNYSYIELKPQIIILGSMMLVENKKIISDIAKKEKITVEEIFINDEDDFFELRHHRANLKYIRDNAKKG